MNKDARRRHGLIPRLCHALLAMMMLGAGGAQAQSVIMNGNYFLTHNEAGTAVNPTATTTFNPATCLWVFAQDNYIRTANSSGAAITSTNNNYLQYSSLALGVNNFNWYNATAGSEVYHRTGNVWNRTYYYLRRNGTTWQINSTDSNNGILYAVTISDVAPNVGTLTITPPANVLNLTGTYAFSHNSPTYRAGYTNYSFNEANHYVDADGNSITPANATVGDYTWSISDNPYATMSAGGGVVTVNSLPEQDMTVTVTCTATVTGGTPAVPAGTTLTASMEVTILGTLPVAPDITVSGNTATITTDAAGTPTIRYTLDGSDPTATTGTEYSGAIDLSTQTNSPVTIKAVTVRDGNVSDVTTRAVTLTLPAPTITTDGAAGTATISSSVAGATIYYTTDGKTPTTSSSVYSGTLTGLATMTTIKAIAVKDGWTTSAVASGQLTIPSGVSGGTVTLFDLEDHNWSYYSDPDCPIRSLNPADVKITYYGNGIVMTGNNDYTASSTDFVKPGQTNYTGGAKVNVGGENENTFVYYKTLERGDATQTAWTYSTTHTSAASRCPYTPIPNPFQVRPTYGSRGTTDANNFTGWRGFQCWRLKKVTGGEVYSAASGGTALAVNAIVNAETEIYFAPNSEYGMEVELEAVWARAYLVKGNNSNANAILDYGSLGVERNFMTLTTNENYRFNGTSGRRITNVDRAVTISCYYVTGNNNNITLGADTKFENVTLSAGSYTLTSSGYNVIVGRGCTSTNVGTVRGMSGGSNSAVDYTIRLESGTYGTFALIDNTARTFSSTVSTKAVFGSDYDRAKTDNGKLSIAANSTIYGGNAVHVFSSASNRNNLTYDWLIKSGKVQGSKSVTDANADESIYIGNSGNNDNTQYMGKRRFTMEGGEIASLAGSLNSYGTNRNNYIVNDGDAVEIRIKGGTIRGSVYGAAAYASATGNRRFVFTGGDVRGWIAGGANGTQSDGGYLYGSTKLYIGGGTSVNSNSSTSVINRAVGGNVFGAGCGYGASSNSGQVTEGTTVVVADDAYVERGVYGGGSYGYTTNTSNVYVLGGHVGGKNGGVSGTTYSGTITGGVFGGACQNQGGTVNITMKDGLVEGGMYGGSNVTGTISGNVTMQIDGGQVGTDATHANIHGGGYGAPTRVTGNVDITLGTTTQTTPGVTVYGDIYGGSALGNVNTNTSNHTNLTLNKGVVYGDAYGGGLGDDSNAALVNGNVTVTENGVAFVKGTTTDDAGNEVENAGRIFGCNNLNGSPQGTVLVHVLKTGRADGGEHTKSVYDSEGNITTYNYEVGAVYGGGNLAPYAPADPTATGQYTGKSHVATSKPVQVVIDGCDEVSIEYVYGGGNAAPVPSTDLVIYGSYELGSVFGGGNGKDKYTRNNGATWNVNPGADVGINGGNYGTGNANTEVYGGFIHELYGASNQKGRIVGSINQIVKVDDSQSDCPLNVLKIVGAGKNADIDQDVNMVMGCMPTAKTELVFAGADNANVNGHVELTITSGTFGKVFGGNNLGGIIKGYIKVNVEETGCTPINIDELYLGGNQAAYSIYGYYQDGTLPDGRPRYLPRTSASDAHAAVDAATFPVPYAQPVLNVISCTSIGKVFGGGLGIGAAMYANPTVNINMIKGAFADNITATADNPNQLGSVENVYGGGNEASVYGNTTVNIGTETSVATVTEHTHLTKTDGKYAVAGAYITGTVYGAGKGVESNPEAGIVTGNAYVTMRSGHVSRSIYGGGELGSVGTFTATYGNGESDIHIEGEPKTCAANTGLTKVLISGGQVGVNHALMPDPADETSNDDFGYVFCACKGLNSGDAVANKLAVSNSSYLEISGTALITASIYGGSENGQMLGNAHVKITGGQIGTGHYKVGNTNYWDGIYTEEQWNTAINKIKAGTFTDADAAPFHQCDAWPFKAEGSRYIYDHDAIYESNGEYYYDAEHTQSSHGGSNKAGSGHSFFGNVFGGGSGYYPYAPGQWRRSAGRVCGNTYVEITGGHILTNVYGGNEITDVIGHCKIEMSGGTVGLPRSLDSIQARPVNSYIFGGGMGDPRIMFNEWSNVGSAEVIVRNNAVVFGSVFGGGEDGHILGDVTTTIQDNVVIGTFGSSGVDGNIFGSGRGFSTLALTAGTVCGNVTVNIKDNVKILGSIYGGGRMATVGTYLVPEGNANYGKLQTGNSHGNVTVNITGGTIGNLSQMNTSEYSIGDVFGGSKGTLMDDWSKSQKLGLVKNTEVNISQADGKTTTIYGNVYGGGELASVGSYEYATASEATTYNTTHPTEPMTEGDVNILAEAGTGKAVINITGGTIGKPEFSFRKGYVFGGCLGRAGVGYSGYSYVANSEVTLVNGTVYSSVFGGGENGHVLDNTKVSIEGGTVGIALDGRTTLTDNMAIYHGNVYGGGRGVDTYNDGGVNKYSITAGKVSGNTNVSVTGGTIYRNVYGGGSLASVGDPDEQPDASGNYKTGWATVTITGGQIGTDGGASAFDRSVTPVTFNHLLENGHVFGSGRGVAGEEGEDYIHLAYVKDTKVTIGGTAYVTGSVFGSGENGHVRKNTNVAIEAGTGSLTGSGEPYPIIGYPLTAAEMVEDVNAPILIYRGNVYGGGRGIDHTSHTNALSATAGIVEGNTNVTITGGTMRHNVYGGGSLARVGNPNETPQADGHYLTGHATIDISGGQIGMSEAAVSTHCGVEGNLYSGLNNGQVYGSGRGLAGAQYAQLAYVKYSHVNISNGSIYGSVFGGGENGHVRKDTEVNISGGTIGIVDYNTATEVYRGNVYGGGRGFDHDETNHNINQTEGIVLGNSNIHITGGTIYHNIYGGGEFGAVLNSVKVNINGGNISGDVYGGGALANTNTTGGATIVNLLGGTILGDAYGGGLGRVAKAAVGTEGNPGYVPAVTAVPAYVNGNVTVTLDGTTFNPTTTTDDASHAVPNSGRVFGCNNLNGTPKGTVLVHVKRTRPYSGARAKGSYEVQAVYGGGNLATYDPTNPEADGQYSENGHDATKKPLQVVIDACDEASIEYVYGGGNAAAAPATDVLILGSYDINKVFAGGNGADKYTLDGGTTWKTNEGADIGWKNSTHITDPSNAEYGKVSSGTVYGTGKSRVIALGGTIGMIFGGSNTLGDVRTSADVVLGDQDLQTCVLEIGEIYGGGNEAYMSASTSLDLKCVEGFNEIYGGARNANVAGDISMTITGGRYNKVFGGNNVGGVISGTITVNVDERGCLPIEIGELYGGGNQAAYSVENIPAARRTSLATASGNANAYKNYPQVNVISATSIGKVFGGGLGNTAVVTGNPHVNINMQKGSVNGDYVYVDGKSPAEYASYASGYEESAGVPRVFPYKLALGTIGIVFGGGNAANVVGDTYVNIGDGTFINENGEASTVTRRSAQITGRVFGGGNNAEVSGNTHVVIGKKE